MSRKKPRTFSEVLVKLDPQIVRPYRAALRHLRKEMGAKAPTLEQLIQHEFAHRTVKIIVEDYLDGGARRPRLRKDSVRIFRHGQRLRTD